MTAVRSKNWRALAFITALMTVFSLAIPFAQEAEANHTAGTTLEVSQETSENTTGTTHSLTATFFNGADPATINCPGPLACVVRFEVESGPAVVVVSDATAPPQRTTDTDNSPLSPDMTCQIPSGQSSCTVSFTSNATGTNVIRAWHDEDRSESTNEADTTETRYSNGPTTTGRAYPTDCRDARGPASQDPSCTQPSGPNQGGTLEPDLTDVVSKTWVQQAGAVCIDAEPETDENASGTDHVITARVTGGALQGGTDTPGTFDCTGAARSGVQVRIDVTDDNPNVFIKSVGGTATTGQPNSADGTTDNNGQVTFTVACVDQNCTGQNEFDVSVPGAAGGSINNPDEVTKDWFAPGQPSSLDATPERDTNEAGQTHTITCRVQDPAAAGASGQNCDAQIVGGNTGNIARDVDNTAATPVGFVGQCFTAADGTCTITYSSSFTGTDDICVWRDTNGNNLEDEADADCTEGIDDPNNAGDFSDVIRKVWVTIGQGPSQVRLDMEEDADPCADFDATADPNAPGTVHTICAQAFNNSNQVAATEITYRIVSGPGFFTDAGGSQNLGSTRTAQADANNENIVFLRSNQSGTTTVEACITGTQTCVQGTKPWRVAQPTDARNIALEPESDTNPPGTLHSLRATVTDVNGNPVPGVNVTWTISGEGGFVNRDAMTDANGTANATITSNQEGTSTVTATIGTAGTQCAQPAGTPPGATAGNCSDTATKTWDEQVDDPQCSDGVDNDGDGLIDFPDDPGCDDADDDDESDVDGPGFGPCQNFAFGSRQPNPVGSGEIIVGTNGDDVLAGSDGDDIICGLDGNDIIAGGGGDDRIVGNAGNDSIEGNGGKDTINGNRGNDTIDGNRKNDVIRGSKGDDTIRGNRGHDTLRGGGGSDTLQGGKGDDILRGGGGNDTLKGFTGDDVLNGGSGTDTCKPGKGNDRVSNCER